MKKPVGFSPNIAHSRECSAPVDTGDRIDRRRHRLLGTPANAATVADDDARQDRDDDAIRRKRRVRVCFLLSSRPLGRRAVVTV